jgi:hypothetical protein
MSGALQRRVSRVMRGRTAEHVIRRRDAAGKEMEILGKLANDPNPNRKEVASYIRELLRKEHIPADHAFQILASIPRDPNGLRNWARVAFSIVMHQGIHAEAAFPRELYPSPQQAPASAAAPTDEDAGDNTQPGQPPQAA